MDEEAELIHFLQHVFNNYLTIGSSQPLFTSLSTSFSWLLRADPLRDKGTDHVEKVHHGVVAAPLGSELHPGAAPLALDGLHVDELSEAVFPVDPG